MAKKLTPKAQELFNNAIDIPDDVASATSNLMLAQSTAQLGNQNSQANAVDQDLANAAFQRAADSEKIAQQQAEDNETTLLDVIGAPSGRVFETAQKYTDEFDANRRAELDAAGKAFVNANLTAQLYEKAMRDEGLGGIDPNFELTKEKYDKWTNGLPEEFKHMFYNVDSDAQGDNLRARFDKELADAKLAGDNPVASGVGMVGGFVFDPATWIAFAAAGAVPGAGTTVAGARIAKGGKVLKDAAKFAELGETSVNMARAESVMAKYIKTQAQKDAFRANPQAFVRQLVADSQRGLISRGLEAVPAAVATGAVSGVATDILDSEKLMLTEEQRRKNLEHSVALGAVFGYGFRAYQTTKAYRAFMQKIDDGINGTFSKVVAPAESAAAAGADDAARAAASTTTADEVLNAANKTADDATVRSQIDEIIDPNGAGARSAVADESLAKIDNHLANLTADAAPAMTPWERAVREIFGDQADYHLGNLPFPKPPVEVRNAENLLSVKQLSDETEAAIDRAITKSELRDTVHRVAPESVTEAFATARAEIVDKVTESLAKAKYGDGDMIKVALQYDVQRAVNGAIQTITGDVERAIDRAVISASGKTLSGAADGITTSVTNDLVGSIVETIGKTTGRPVTQETVGIILKAVEPVVKTKVREMTTKVSNKLESFRVSHPETIGAAKGKTFGETLSTRADEALAFDNISKLKILGHTPASAKVMSDAKRILDSITKIDGVVGASSIARNNVLRGSFASNLAGGIRVPLRNAPSNAIKTVNADGQIVAHIPAAADDAAKAVVDDVAKAEESIEPIADLMARNDVAKAAHDTTLVIGGTKEEAEAAARAADDAIVGNTDNTVSATVDEVDEVVKSETDGLASLVIPSNGHEGFVTSGAAKGAINASALDPKWKYHVAFDRANSLFSGVAAVSRGGNTMATTVMRQIEGDVTGVTNTAIKGEHGLANYAMMRAQGDTTRVVEKYMPALAEEIKARPGINRDVVRDDFDKEMFLRAHGYDNINGIPMSPITPAKQRLLDEYRKVNAEHVDNMLNPGKEFGKTLRPLEGATERKLMNEGGNYVHHRQNMEAFKGAAAEFGTNGLIAVIKGAIKSAIPDIPEGTLNAVARSYPQYALGATSTRALRIANAATTDTKQFLREVLEANADVSKESIDDIIASLRGSRSTSSVGQLNQRQIFDMNYSAEMTTLNGELKTIRMTDLFETNLALLTETASLNVHRGVSKANIIVKGVVDDTGVEKVIFDGIRTDADRVSLMSAIEQVNGYQGISIKKQRSIMKELNASIDRMSGIPPEGSDSLANLYTRRLMAFSSTTSSGAFGVAALMELFKPLTTTGFRFANSMPVVKNIIRDSRTGKLSDADAEALSSITALGKEQDTQWVMLKLNRSYEHSYEASISGGLDKAVDNTLRKSSAWMQWANAVQPITKMLTRAIMHHTMHRVVRLSTQLAETGASVITKNPRRWMTYGIDKDTALKFAEQARLHGSTVGGTRQLNLHLWDDATRFEFVRVVQNIGSRSIQQGDRFRLRSQFNNPLIRLLAQFKSFAINSYAKDFLFQLHARDMESLGTFLGVAAANALSYSAVVAVKSLSQEDPQAYRDENLSDKMIAMAVFSRGPHALPLGLFGGPMFATVGLQNPNLMFKTHLAYAGQTSYASGGGRGTDIVESLAASAPALRAKDIPISGYSILSSIWKGEAIDNRDLKTLGGFLMPLLGGKQAVDIAIDALNPDGKYYQ